jgi:hypothetical protein
MESAATPENRALGSDLLSRLAVWYVGAIPPLPFLLTLAPSFSANHHLTPHAQRCANILLFHLEQPPST